MYILQKTIAGMEVHFHITPTIINTCCMSLEENYLFEVFYELLFKSALFKKQFTQDLHSEAKHAKRTFEDTCILCSVVCSSPHSSSFIIPYHINPS